MALLLLGVGAGAQQTFDVVSIRPCRGAPPPEAKAIEESPQRLRFACATVDQLIRNAYILGGATAWTKDPATGSPVLRVPQTQMLQVFKGSPAWTTSARFTVEARAARPVSADVLYSQMLPALLRDRFKLQLHHEAREVSIYELTATPGAKLQPFRAGDCVMLDGQHVPAGRMPVCAGLGTSPSGGVASLGVTLPQFCTLLSQYTEVEVTDKTGIAGLVNIHLDLNWADLLRGPSQAPADAQAALQSALRKAGFTLVPAKTKMNFLVLDHVERPAAN